MENTENHNFEKNISAIQKYNPKLAVYLKAITEIKEDIQLVNNKKNEPILTYNGMPLHSNDDAEAEAKRIFNQTSNSPIAIHVVFGIGLGYLFQEFALKSKGIVILYEPDVELLRLTLELVDFSKELSKNNVRVVSNLNDVKQIILTSYKYKCEVTFSSLPSYRKIYEKNFNEIIQSLQTTVGISLSEYKTTKDFLAMATDETLDNIPNLIDETPLVEFKNRFEGKTALIVSAGPSLDLNIKTIKKYRDKFVLFTVGTAYKALLKNGIKPDFLNIIESKDCFYQVQDTDLSDIYLILEPSTYKLFHQVKAKLKLSFFANTNPINLAWAKFVNVKTDEYETQGTVSFEALASAKILGFKKIILIGQDLAYINKRCYSKDSVYSDLICELNSKTNKFEIKPQNYEHYKQSIMTKNNGHTDEIAKWFADYRLKQLNETLFTVKGINGEMLPTESTFATYIEHFKNFAKNNSDLTLINSSMIGADIEGFENIPLDKVLKNEKTINEKIELKSDFKYDKELLLNNLDKEERFLQNSFDGLQKNEANFNKYDEAFKETNKINQETNKYFKILLNYYSQLRTQASTESNIFNAIAFSEDIEIQYLISKSDVVDEKIITEVYNALKQYYSIVKSRISSAINKIKKAKDLI